MFGLASGGAAMANNNMSNVTTGFGGDNTLTMSQSMMSNFNDSAAATTTIGHHGLSMYDFNPEDIYDTTNAISQLKAAFIYHLKKNTTKCGEILRELQTSLNNDAGDDNDAETASEIDLDSIIVVIARDLADDIPAADPRWEDQLNQSETAALGSSNSMQIIQQLKDKNMAMKLFLDFLRTTELWQRLSKVTDRGGARRATVQVFADVHEQIVAAIALKRIHTK